MAKILELGIENEQAVCNIGRAIASPVRLKLMELLGEGSFSITQISEQLDIPNSSAAFHLKLLENAGLVRVEEQPGSRGKVKLCSRKQDFVNLMLLARNTKINEVIRMEMPVGAFFNCKPYPTCGLCAPDGVIGMEDREYSFYLQERMNAGLFYTSAGDVEYRFSNQMPRGREMIRLSFGLELCSEVPGYKEDWKSDITMWINGIECATWQSPGDFGGRRGRYTPPFWDNGSTQYGIWTKWEIRNDGTYVNDRKKSSICLEDLRIEENAFVSMKIGNKQEAKYIGGFNIFGKTFGDYPEDIVMEMEYC